MFIGSSTESLEISYALQENLESDFEVTVWNQGLFDLSQYILDGLVDVLSEVDFGVFVFASDDITKMRGSEYRTVRDNVLFELGLFIGSLGRERCFIILPRGTNDFHLPTDLLGITPATFEPNRQDKNLNAALGPACAKIRKAVDKIRPREISAAETMGVANELDDNDCISLLESWMGSRPSGLNTQAIRYSDVDREVGLPVGSAIKFLEIAASKWGYKTSRKGKETILLAG